MTEETTTNLFLFLLAWLISVAVAGTFLWLHWNNSVQEVMYLRCIKAAEDKQQCVFLEVKE